MKHVAAWLLWFVALWFLWMLLVGEWNVDEWVAAASASAVAATVGEIARARAGARPTEGIAKVARLYAVPPIVVVDFGLLMWALVRALVTRRIPDGSFRECDAADPWTALLASYSPNAYVLDRHELHRLVPFEKSEDPA